MAGLDRPAVVLDCGTGFLKMGLAGAQGWQEPAQLAMCAPAPPAVPSCARCSTSRLHSSPASLVMSWLCCQPWPHASASPAHTPSGDEAPRFVEPTVVAYHGAGTGTSGLRSGGKAAAAADPLADLDYSFGHAALANAAGSALTYPMKGGVISDFDSWCGREGLQHSMRGKQCRSSAQQRLLGKPAS